MRQLCFFQRLGPIGTLNLLHLLGLIEAFLQTLARGEEFDAPPEALLYWLWLAVSGLCFMLARHFIFADGTWAMGKVPAFRSGFRKWFLGFSALNLAFSILVLGWLGMHGQFVWLTTETVLAFVKLQLIRWGNRLFRSLGE